MIDFAISFRLDLIDLKVQKGGLLKRAVMECRSNILSLSRKSAKIIMNWWRPETTLINGADTEKPYE